MYDYIIRGGTIIDGSGAEGVAGDVAVQDGRIAAVGGRIDAPARETIDAEGAIVTPAWVDIHTHYDGQVTWDAAMDPSASHGVGTIVMGNCGVGFAPVQPDAHRDLIDLMEGVEDIPGTALYEGMPWGAWQTYPEYLEFLAGREYALDIASLVAHGAVRNYVMGERGRSNQAATEGDLDAMGAIVEEALRAGAVGFSTSRILGHRSIQGEPVPGTYANDAEVMIIAQALKRAGSGVFQIIPASTLGEGQPEMLEHSSLESEVDLITRVSRSSGRPATFTLFQVDAWSDKWREVIDRVRAANADGAQVYPQVGSRPTGLVMSLRTYHPYMRKPTYLKLRERPLEQRLTELRKPEVKAAILAETSVPHELPGTMENGIAHLEPNFEQTFALDGSSTYEPTREESFAALAARDGYDDPRSWFYDYLTGGQGERFAIMFFTNYSDYSLDAVRAMQLDDTTVTGLSDAGAHVSLIFDAVNPTYQLTYWTRDRSRGPTLPLAHVVHRATRRNAELFGFHDRGLVAEGLRADLNVIDYAGLKLGELELRRDLPAGGMRLMQSAHGYLATLVNGVVTRRFDQDTGARPGRLVRNMSSR
ncbi:MAG: amidohydrolase family protein [Gammaproteobacteria bacterium]|nr:amidohydrolase family protein [Gammaproteobacteria bacterium]